MKIVIDTNFWMDIFKFKIDLSEIYDLLPGSQMATISQVVDELNRLAAKKTNHSKFARLALEFIKSKSVNVIKTPESGADKALLKMSDKETVIATDDSVLKKNIEAKGGKIIYILGRKHIALS